MFVILINESEKLSVVIARLLSQYILEYQTGFFARFDKPDEDNQLLHETELSINLNVNHNLTETDHDNTDSKSPLDHQIQQQEMKDSGGQFDKNNSVTIYFYQTCIMNGRSYVKIPLRSNAILNFENNDEY